jgi:hypothetical protein
MNAPSLIDTNWLRLLTLVEDNITSQRAEHLDMLHLLEHDHPTFTLNTTDHLTYYLGFKRAPAAKRNHHDHEGGLVTHLLQMWECYLQLEPMIREMDGDAAAPVRRPTHEQVLKAILYHDLHKACLTYVLVSETPWETKYGEDTSDKLLTHDTKTLWILNKAGIKLSQEQTNAILWAEGGFSQTRPQWSSVLAKLVYVLDEFSGNVLDRVRKGTTLDLGSPAREGPFSHHSR